MEQKMFSECKCYKCKKVYPVSPPKSRSSKLCVDCFREYSREYRKRRKAEGNPVVSKQMDRDKKRAWAKRYNQRPEVKAKTAERQIGYRKQPDCILKNRARMVTRNRLKSGVITKGACVICGTKTKIEGHHPDYTKPEEVVWVCQQHHNDVHSGKIDLDVKCPGWEETR